MQVPDTRGYYLVVVPGLERSRFRDERMTGAVFSYALLAALATALLVAAVTDLRRREIGNRLNLGIALAAPLWWLAIGLGPTAIAIQIVLTAVTFAVACGLFVAGQMGGGDVKLITALALWFAPQSFLQLVMLMAILGGGGSLVLAAFNMKRVPGETIRDALAVIAALTWVACIAVMVIAVATHRPILPPAAIAAVAGAMPGTGAIALALAIVAMLVFGMRHILARQKAPVDVPYGIAISAASLWVIGTQTLSTAWIAARMG